MRASRHILLLGLAAGLLLATTGCKKTARVEKDVPDPTGERYAVELDIGDGEAIRFLQRVDVTAHITENGETVRNAAVDVDLSMPKMKMPRNNVELKWRQKARVYTGEVVFTMNGDWQLAVRITDQAGAEETHYFRHQID